MKKPLILSLPIKSNTGIFNALNVDKITVQIFVRHNLEELINTYYYKKLIKKASHHELLKINVNLYSKHKNMFTYHDEMLQMS